MSTKPRNQKVKITKTVVDRFPIPKKDLYHKTENPDIDFEVLGRNMLLPYAAGFYQALDGSGKG